MRMQATGGVMALVTHVARLCNWCGRNEAPYDAYGAMCGCELEACGGVFCGASCADFHMGKHEDYGDCVRDRNGEVISPRRRASRRFSSELVRKSDGDF